jgi:protein-S-isoprenylcysteine O-methyltransferase Ste14
VSWRFQTLKNEYGFQAGSGIMGVTRRAATGRRNMQVMGKPTINPALFYTGKISGYAAWILFALSVVNLFDLSMIRFMPFRWASFFILGLGLLFTVFSMINLGKSTTLGLPDKDTVLKIHGIYRISRNPMYVGFNLLTISSVLYIQNVFILLAGLYSICIYHFIILSEEKFLENRFGSRYLEYKAKVRRYF